MERVSNRIEQSERNTRMWEYPDLSISISATGLVYRNPYPNLRAVHAWHPTVTRLSNGDMLCACDLGQGCESMDYCTHLSRSQDAGETWTMPRKFVQEYSSRHANTLVRIRALSDNSVVAFGGYLYRDDPDRGFVNPDNLGYTPMDLILSRSIDGGETWETPSVLHPPLVGPSWEICHAIVEVTDGRWLAPVSTWKSWDGEAPSGMRAVALVSYDRGHSWPEYLTVLDDYVNGNCSFEQSLVQLRDGRLLAVVWSLHEATGATNPTPYVISSDGHTFSPPRLTGFHAQTTKIVCLNDGRILCLYRRHDKPGLWGNIARIEDEKWINLEETPIWQGAISGMSGVNTPGAEMKELRFGFPSMTVLNNSEVFVVFWCQEDGINNIRWMLLRIG